jgi:Ferritin-like domain
MSLQLFNREQGAHLEPRARSRRGFLRGFGAASAGAAVTALAATGAGVTSAKAANLDVAILQFALNLEYLESEFYNRAAFGNGLGAAVTGVSPSNVIGGRQVNFSSPLIKAYAEEIAREERKHVLFLRAALGSSVVNQPALDLQNSFRTLGIAAGLSSDFDPFADDMSFMLGAYIFEDVGVTAYHGAAPLITDKNYLDKAAGILAVEAYHAGLVRTVLFANNQTHATAAIANLRATLDGTYNTANVDDHGVGTTTFPNIVDCSDGANGSLLGGFPSNSPPGDNAIAYDRTTRQVLNIVYGGVNATKGLFFPNGMNGTITS